MAWSASPTATIRASSRAASRATRVGRWHDAEERRRAREPRTLDGLVRRLHHPAVRLLRGDVFPVVPQRGKYRVMSTRWSRPSAASAPHDAGRHDGPPDSAVDPAGPAAAEPEAEEQRRAKAERVRNMAEEIRKVLARWWPTARCGSPRAPSASPSRSMPAVLFAPGEAQLGPDAVRALRAVAQVVADAEFPDHRRGAHRRDADRQRHVSVELGAGPAVRASSVVRLFVENRRAPVAAHRGGLRRPAAGGRQRHRRGAGPQPAGHDPRRVAPGRGRR